MKVPTSFDVESEKKNEVSIKISSESKILHNKHDDLNTMDPFAEAVYSLAIATEKFLGCPKNLLICSESPCPLTYKKIIWNSSKRKSSGVLSLPKA